MLIKRRKKTNTFWKVLLFFIIKKQNQIGIYLFEYNVKQTVKMFENVQYTSERRAEKVHSIETIKRTHSRGNGENVETYNG